MFINNYFNTTIWSEQKPEFVKSLTKASNKYIKDARTREKNLPKNAGDLGGPNPSKPLPSKNNFLDLENTETFFFLYIENFSFDLLHLTDFPLIY